MQASPHTLADVAYQAVTILGSGLLALAGSWIALRYQRKLKQTEIDSQAKLKARELMFNAYQQKLNTQTEELKSLSAALTKFHISIVAGDKEAQKTGIYEVMATSTGIGNHLLHLSSDVIELELKDLNLLDKYKEQLEGVRRAAGMEIVEGRDLKLYQDFFFEQSKAVSNLLVITQALLDKKRDQLFSEYLPSEIILR